MPHPHECSHTVKLPLLPLSQLNERFTELDANQQYYLHCKAGVRSLMLCGDKVSNTSRASKTSGNDYFSGTGIKIFLPTIIRSAFSPGLARRIMSEVIFTPSSLL